MTENVVHAGLWSFVPALTAIVTVFIFRDVILSLLTGIVTGAAIYAVAAGTGLRGFLNQFFDALFSSASDNLPIITLIFLLGALVSVIAASGGHTAYGRWVAKKIKSARGITFSTVLLGFFVFIDDYYSCFLIGTVMGPLVGKYKVSREKLAYLIDSTAAPICILAPISTWAMTITKIIKESGVEGGLLLFFRSIPYNFYAIFALGFALYIAVSRRDFAYMKKYEADPLGERNQGAVLSFGEELEPCTDRGKIIDLVLPNVAVIFLSLVFIFWLGDFFGPGKISLMEAYARSDATTAINFGFIGAILLCFFMYIPRRLLTIHCFFERIMGGMKSMFTGSLVLVFAWTLSTITIQSLGAAVYVEAFMNEMKGSFDISFLPVIIFIFSAVISFGLGSWGTFLTTIPFVAVIAETVNPSGFFLYLAATLAGSVFGDHVSPITDTTIISSISAGCAHVGHVKSQMPYGMLACFGASCAFLLAGFSGSLILSYAAGIAAIVVAVLIICRFERSSNAG